MDCDDFKNKAKQESQIQRMTGMSIEKLEKIINETGMSLNEVVELKRVANETGVTIDEVVELRNLEKNRIKKSLIENEKRTKKKFAQEKIRDILSKDLNLDREIFDLIDKNNDRNIPTEVKKEVYDRDKGICVFCGSNNNLEYDHILPFSKGGSNSSENVQLLCLQCNRTKHNKII